MTGLQIASILGLLVVVLAQDYDTFIDPYSADDSFNVDCGNTTDHRMVIVFRGNAHKLYAPSLPGCEGVETEPAHLKIADAITHPLCTPHKVPGMEVYSLEVVVQKGNVRRYDDSIHMVTCSYELGGAATSNVRDIYDSELPRLTNLVYATAAQSQVTLSVRDVTNTDTYSVHIGSYIQLVGLMTPVGDEESFQMWNCRAFTNETGVFVEHNVLVEGCGDNLVIRRDRGFRTGNVTDDAGNDLKMARSVFFRAFSLLGNKKLRFECEYLITKDNSTDGPSCKRSPAALNAIRHKRSVTADLDLPHSQTSEINLTPQTATLRQNNVLTYTLKTEDSMQQPTFKQDQPINLRRPYLGNSAGLVTRGKVAPLSQIGLLRQPLVLALLTTCCLVVAVMLVAATVLLLVRIRMWHAHNTSASSPRYRCSIPIYTANSPGYITDSATCSKTTKQLIYN